MGETLAKTPTNNNPVLTPYIDNETFSISGESDNYSTDRADEEMEEEDNKEKKKC